MRNTRLFTPGVARSCRGLILLQSKEGHSPFSSHDDHRVVLKSDKMQPINYSRGQRGQSLAWNWARSYQSAGAGEGDICLWDSLTLSNFFGFSVFSCQPSFLFLSLVFAHAMPVTEQSVPPFLVCTSLYNLCSLSCVSLCLLIFFVCLYVQTPTRTLFHGSPSPLFTHSLTSSLFQHLSNSPPSPFFLSVLSSLSFYALLHHLPLQRYVLLYLFSNAYDRIKPWCTFLQCDANMIW